MNSRENLFLYGMVKIFHFSDEWKVLAVAPQMEVYTANKSRGVFLDILAIGNWVNTLYGLEI